MQPGGCGAIRFVGGNADLLPAALLAASRDWRSWVHADDRDALEAALEQVRWHTTRDFRLAPATPDTRVQWLRVTAAPCGQQGQRWIDCYAENVIEAHEAGTRLQMLSRVAEQISDAVVVIDAGGEIIYTNAACEAMTGYPAHALQHNSLAELSPEMDVRAAGSDVARTLAPG